MQQIHIHSIKRFPTIFFFALTFALVLGEAAAQPANEKRRVSSVDAIGMTVVDMDRSIDFYSKVLTFEKMSDVEVWGVQYEHLQGLFGLRMRVVRMKLGEETIELTEYLSPQGRPFPVDTKSNDHWFQHIAIVVSNMEKAYERLRESKVKHASTGPQRIPDWNVGAAGIKAFYFRDPDGHYLEVIYFPPGKGDPKWQRPANKLFLGIDHTAIVVSSMDESLKFYRDELGLRVAGESENYGTEQEHLNNIFGARLRISGLRANSGPGIELLEYLAPGDGRSTSVDIKANDIAHWQTRLIVENVDSTWTGLRRSNGSFVSPGPISIPDSRLGYTKGLLARDPDGHALLFVQQENMQQ
jgi:catechol 2,3-dioxygenase-like lactoylglutathione lyase family enzyme